MHKVNIYKDASGEYRWERRAENGSIVSDSGEGYKNAQDCIDIALKVNKGAAVFFLGQPIVEIQS